MSAVDNVAPGKSSDSSRMLSVVNTLQKISFSQFAFSFGVVAFDPSGFSRVEISSPKGGGGGLCCYRSIVVFPLFYYNLTEIHCALDENHSLFGNVVLREFQTNIIALSRWLIR